MTTTTHPTTTHDPGECWDSELDLALDNPGTDVAVRPAYPLVELTVTDVEQCPAVNPWTAPAVLYGGSITAISAIALAIATR